MSNKVDNYINGQWIAAHGEPGSAVINPATQEVISEITYSSRQDVADAIRAAKECLPDWRRIPAVERIQYLFKLKSLLEERIKDLATMITKENGKTLNESVGEMRRAIENVEVACGIPTLGQGLFSEDIARGVDEIMIRQPVGVCGIIAPFNFPAMISFWFFPYAIALGNTVVIKPSERTPLTMKMVCEMLHSVGLPKGVVNLVQGDRIASEVILEHPDIRAISFVGSTKVAAHVYAKAAENGKRVQCGGGAKNPIVILPDADMQTASQIVSDSAFGNAGQRCLAASLVVTVGDAKKSFDKAITDLAQSIKVGYGLEEGIQMGPVITPESQSRIEGIIERAPADGAEILLDGRYVCIEKYPKGNFIKPTIIGNVSPKSELATTEVFGPVLGLEHVETLDDAITLINQSKYGNQASIFTANGAAARKFRYEVDAGNVGVNIGVAAPMAFFPFSGWNASFFGDLHGQGKDAIEFFTQKKVVVERWPKEWTRKF